MRYTTGHFLDVARILDKAFSDGKLSKTSLRVLVAAFSSLFESSNEHFKPHLFKGAAMLTLRERNK
jgi:hypothetical protein